MGKRTNILIILSLLLLLLAAVACGPKKAVVAPPAGGYLYYPSPPDPARYQYLTTISTARDIEKEKSGFYKFVAGKDEKKPLEILKPYGVELFEGILYVADMKAGAVDTLNLNTGRFDYLGLRGAGKLIRPVNLRIDRQQRRLYVADMGRKQVLCYDLDGNLLTTYGTAGQFDPSDVELADDRLLVCDVKGHRIHVLDRTTGEPRGTIGRPGSKDGELFHPTNICVHGDRLYVSDTSNFRIAVFRLDGTFIRNYGRIGNRPGNFSRTKGVAVDGAGRLYAVDAAFENVQVFDDQFKLLMFFLHSGSEPDNINLPADIAINTDSISCFRKYIAPGFQVEYLLLVSSQFGPNKINVYAFGKNDQE